MPAQRNEKELREWVEWGNSNSAYGIQGGVLQMFSHGVNVVGFFLCYYMIVKRTNTDVIVNLGGIAQQAPKFATIFLIIVLANVALPLTNSFVGEFLILMGVFQFNKTLAIVAGLTVILGASLEFGSNFLLPAKMYNEIESVSSPTNSISILPKAVITNPPISANKMSA